MVFEPSTMERKSGLKSFPGKARERGRPRTSKFLRPLPGGNAERKRSRQPHSNVRHFLRRIKHQTPSGDEAASSRSEAGEAPSSCWQSFTQYFLCNILPL